MARHDGWKSVLTVAAIAAAAAGVGHKLFRSDATHGSGPGGQAATSTPMPNRGPVVVPAGREGKGTPSPRPAARPRKDVGPSPGKPASAPPLAIPAAAELPAASLPAQKLITRLVQWNAAGGATSEGAAAWKQTFQDLVAQGAPAVPAILQFMGRNVDIGFGDPGTIATLGSPSARMALIEALHQIGGPEGQAASLQLLRSAALPEEIETLARNIEQQAAGQFRPDILAATRETLAMAAAGQLGDRDVGPLFRVLEAYGDAGTVTELEQQLSQWKYYATIALANLPDGEGIPALARQAGSLGAGGGTRADFAFQMLAQVSSEYPQAAATLMEMARLNQIPDSAWRKIGIGLASDQQFLAAGNGGTAPEGVSGFKTYHIAAGNQNFFSLPLQALGQDNAVQKRSDLIAQLLAVNSSPSAVQALTEARAALTPGRR